MYLCKMNLVVDIGNTQQKASLFEHGKMIHFVKKKKLNDNDFLSLVEFSKKPKIRSIISSVTSVSDQLLKNFAIKPILFSHKTPIPISIAYKTPETLGTDRIAAAVAATNIFPNKNVLVIDAGTCITWDIITSEGSYLGGGISPGIDMRFRALHTFTAQLPLLEQQRECSFIGDGTQQSIATGVLSDVAFGMQGIVYQCQKQFPDLKIVVGGGDYKYFVEQLKSSTFALPELVLSGLNIILDYNK